MRVLYGGQGTPFPTLATARYVVSVLDQLGYRASLRLVGTRAYWNVLGDSRDRVQIGFFGWFQDYPAPSDFVDPVLTCSSFLPANPDNNNTAEFCDTRVDAEARQALADQQIGDPATTASQWATIDRELVDQAPWVSLYNPRDLTVLSARTSNYPIPSLLELAHRPALGAVAELGSAKPGRPPSLADQTQTASDEDMGQQQSPPARRSGETGHRFHSALPLDNKDP